MVNQAQYRKTKTIEDLSTLPSKGLSYPKGSSVTYYGFTFGEVKKASSSSQTILQKLDSIADGIEVEGFPKVNLTLGDLMYIGFMRKLMSFKEPKINVAFRDADNQLINHVMPIDGIEVDDIEAPELPLTVDFDTETVEMMPLTYKDFVELVRAKKMTDEVALLAKMIKNMEFEKAEKFISGLGDSDDFEVIKEIESLLSHSIKPVEVTYEKETPDGLKEVTIKVGLDGGQALITPFREDRSAIRNRIHFGKRDVNISDSPKSDGLLGSGSTGSETSKVSD